MCKNWLNVNIKIIFNFYNGLKKYLIPLGLRLRSMIQLLEGEIKFKNKNKIKAQQPIIQVLTYIKFLNKVLTRIQNRQLNV